jgi:hypothetical protein
MGHPGIVLNQTGAQKKGAEAPFPDGSRIGKLQDVTPFIM